MLQKPHQPDYVLYFTVLILTAIGIVTVYSASSVWALNNSIPADSFAVKQVIAAVLGVVVLTVTMQWIPYSFWFKRAVLLTLIITAMLVLVLIPGIGHANLGSRRWFGSGSYHLQPSELAVVFTVLYLSYFFTRKVEYLHDFKRGLRPAIIMVGVQCALIMLEPDMGTTMTLLGTAVTVIFASGARLKRMLFLSGALIPVIAALGLMSYRSSRVSAWLHPFANTNSTSYQLLQGWTAIASGGWFGRGFGESIEKTGYLPVPQADFIFPVFTEEWGYFGAIALLVIFGVLIWRGFTIARYAGDRFSALVAVGVTSMVVIKTFINLGAVTGLLPVTGIPLPFISYGGTSLVVDLAAIGILLNISRYTRTEAIDVDDDIGEVIPLQVPGSPEAPPRRQRQQGSKRRPAQRSGAKVQPLRPQARRNPAPASTGGWRARQEAAATHAKPRRETMAPAQTWRERSQPVAGKRASKPNTNKHGKPTKGDWRG